MPPKRPPAVELASALRRAVAERVLGALALGNAVDVRHHDRGAVRAGVRRHLDDFDVAFLRPVEAVAAAVAGVGEVDEVHARLQQGVDRDRARVVGRGDLGAAGRGGLDRRRPHVKLRQEHVEVEHFLAAPAFEEADLDRLRRAVRVDHGYQRVVRVAGPVGLDRVVRIDQDLAKAVGIDLYGVCSRRHAQRTRSCQGCVQRFSLERVHGF